MELEFARAKKEVWERRRVVRVMDAGVRVRRAGCVGQFHVFEFFPGGGPPHRGKRTEEEVLKAEEEVEGDVFCFCLGEEEEGC